MEEVDILEILLDPDNKNPIRFMDGNGKEISFEQIAVIPYKEDGLDELYCILKPIDKIDGIADDEAIVFCIDTDDEGKSLIRVETDEEKAIKIFECYNEMIKEAQNNG